MGVVAGAALLGLTLGVAALVVALSLLSGFQSQIRSRLLALTPHLLVTPAGRTAFRPEEGLSSRLSALPGVTGAAPVVRGRVWLSTGSGSAPAEAYGAAGERGLVLDSGLARSLSALPGEEVTLVSSRSRLSPLGPVPIVGSLALSDVSAPASGRRLPQARMPLPEARRLLGLPEGAATGFELRLSEPGDSEETAGRVRAALGEGVKVTTWQEANRPLMLALELERTVLFATIFLIVVVAGLNLAATAAVLAATRASDAAVLSVLGASPRQVGSVFLAAGGLVGAAGTAAGLAAGTALAVLLDRTEAIPLPSRLYAVSHVPFRPDPVELLLVLVLSLAWSFLVSLPPARQAARLDVPEVLRGA